MPEVLGAHAQIAMGVKESHAESIPDPQILRPAFCVDHVVRFQPAMEIPAFIPVVAMNRDMIRILLAVSCKISHKRTNEPPK